MTRVCLSPHSPVLTQPQPAGGVCPPWTQAWGLWGVTIGLDLRHLYFIHFSLSAFANLYALRILHVLGN